MTPRVATLSRADITPVSEFAADVGYYLSLTPRQLPSRYLYDELGSVLFDAICRLPWYTITRAEMRLLRAHRGEILDSGTSFANIVELGPGNGEKLRSLLDSSIDISAVETHCPSRRRFRERLGYRRKHGGRFPRAPRRHA
jgi:uncharacterized SAM-dependent methyltransferase